MKQHTATSRILATDVVEGMVLAEVLGEFVRRGLLRRGYCRLRGRHLADGYPVVTKAKYELIGEGGTPTVYIQSSEMPGWSWCLDPNEIVSVIA